MKKTKNQCFIFGIFHFQSEIEENFVKKENRKRKLFRKSNANIEQTVFRFRQKHLY